LDDAVRSHLLADVPLGVCLSGGVDSSLLSSFASRTQRLSAFTIDTRSEYSELQHARTVARTLGLALFQLDVEPESFAQNFELWAYHNDDPVSDPSALALMLLMQHARTQGMKVMLSGEGADELFGGYNAYLRLWLVSHLSQGTPLAARHWLARSMSGRWRDYLAEPAALRYFGAGHMTTRALKHELLAPEILGSDAEELERTSFPLDPKQPNWLRQAMRWDHAMRLPYDVLARTDRATMAFSVEGRVPFLDRRVVELANQLPDSECFDVLRMTGKPLLKELAARAVPRSIIYRKKRGFDLPVGHWLRVRFAELSRSFLSERRVPGLNYAGVQRVFEAHVSRERDSSAPLWGWLVLEKWYRLWVLGTASPLPAAVAMAQDAQALLDPKPHDGMPSGDPIAARGLHP
jgi:asparagine synthase (glutamine-hydrolysing)